MLRLLTISCILLYFQAKTFAQTDWTFELHGGTVYNVPLPLTIHQQNYLEIKLRAKYDTEALNLPVYWNMRLSRWQNQKSWELELIHHKLYLNNTTPEVQKFNISHGFNMLFVNRAFEGKHIRFRLGAGAVISHPESNIRGKEFGDSTDDFDSGYFLTGPGINLGISKTYHLGNRLFLSTEAKTTFAYSYIKVAEGHANVYNLALHILVGLGYEFIKQK